MKIGYVSRTTPNNPYDHQILATQFLKPKELATQLGKEKVLMIAVLPLTFTDSLLTFCLSRPELYEYLGHSQDVLRSFTVKT